MQHKHRLVVRGLALFLAALVAVVVAATIAAFVAGPNGVREVREGARARVRHGSPTLSDGCARAQTKGAAARTVHYTSCVVTAIAHPAPCGAGCGDWTVSYGNGNGARGVIGCAASPDACAGLKLGASFACEVDPAVQGVVRMEGAAAAAAGVVAAEVGVLIPCFAILTALFAWGALLAQHPAPPPGGCAGRCAPAALLDEGAAIAPAARAAGSEPIVRISGPKLGRSEDADWVAKLPPPFNAHAFSELAMAERSGPAWIPHSARHIVDVSRVSIVDAAAGAGSRRRSISSASNVVEEVCACA